MTEQEVNEIYKRLLELTTAGKVKWEQTGEQEFTTNFSRSSVSVGIDNNLPERQVALIIYNDTGLMVAYAAPETGRGFVDFGVKEFNLDATRLYRRVRKIVEEGLYKYSETSKSILDELKELELSEKGK
jgi:hypothetical protein